MRSLEEFPVNLEHYIIHDANFNINKQTLNTDELKFSNQIAVTKLGVNWSPLFILGTDAGIKLLILENQVKNEKAIWYFSSENNFLGNSSKSILENGNLEINDTINILFNRIILECIEPTKYDSILLDKTPDALWSDLKILNNCIEKNSTFITATDKNSIDSNILAIKGKDFQDSILEKNNLSLNIADNGVKLIAHSGLVINDFIIAYPLFIDNQLNRIIFIGSHLARPIFVLDTFTLQSFKNYPIDGIFNQLLNHFKNNWPLIRKYFSNTSKSGVISITRDSHIGHRLWNELSGYYRIKQKGLTRNLYKIIHFQKEGVGVPWPTADFIINKTALNQTNITDINNLATFTYENNGFPLRIGDDYIPLSLINEISEYCITHSKVKVPAKEINEIRIVFGLRFENRTWTNQIEGLSEIACYLASKTTKLTIVVDGHDCIDGNSVLSFAEHHSNISIIDLEKSALKAIQASIDASEYKDKVKIIDAVNLDLYSTMAWILSSDFFISPWGAGLTKYKWIANLDGVIFSSKEVLTNKGDLKIYENPAIREEASNCIYLDVNYVTDLDPAENKTNVSFKENDKLRMNFIVNISGLKLTIDKLLVKLNSMATKEPKKRSNFFKSLFRFSN